MTLAGRAFYKMTGSGNDFVIFDARSWAEDAVGDPAVVGQLCAPRTGVGADGVVYLLPSRKTPFRMRYLNRDGSAGAMCGNAALCVTRLAVDLGLGHREGFEFESDSGTVRARIAEGRPEVDLEPVAGVRDRMDLPREPGESRIGFAEVGVPHLVVECDQLAGLDVDRRGSTLRHHPSLIAGANVNFVARGQKGWSYRTFERGVEGETLACGTGAVATALFLKRWGLSDGSCTLTTRSGEALRVRLTERGGDIIPSLSGEGRLVFVGTLREI